MIKKTLTTVRRFNSSLHFNGFNRCLEPGATYRHPSLPAIELKIEENPNRRDRFSIYIPEVFNNPLGDAFDTKLDLIKWSSQFEVGNPQNYRFLVSETPGSVLAPGCNYEMRLLAHMHWYWVFAMDDLLERLSASHDKNSKLLTVTLLAIIRDLTTGRESPQDIKKLPISSELDLQVATQVLEMTKSVVQHFRKVLPITILRHW